MAINITRLFDSTRTFISPVRKFKDNDPYYWEIDNIPISQLEENTLWLKDQIENLDFSISGLTRAEFGELQPTFSGTDRVVRVSPGRFTGRVNDAYNLSSLVLFNMVNPGSSYPWLDVERSYQSTVEQVATTSNILQQFFDGSAVVNINGLEYNFWTWANNHVAVNKPVNITYTSDDIPEYVGAESHPWRKSWPFLDVKSFPPGIGITAPFPLASRTNQELGFFLHWLSSDFVKMWRGVARLAVVDIPETLTINIPPFNSEEFFSRGTDGTITDIESIHRIDLLFVYTKPVDVDKVSLQRGTYVEEITEPKLGLIVGAGIGLRKNIGGVNLDKIALYPENREQDERYTNFDPATDLYYFLPNVGDQESETNGFKIGPLSKKEIHGSFPSPDDLLNITPQLLNNLESTDPRLLGQSILPIAYIVTEKPGANDVINSTGQYPLTNDAILDIRPFFRTAELSYNERAGIAAATPQLSLANPAVGQVQLHQYLMETSQTLREELAYQEKAITLAKGTVFGGMLYGPEGTILKSKGFVLLDGETGLKKVYTANGLLTGEASRELGYAGNANVKVPMFPAWDFAPYVETAIDRGTYPNDWVHTSPIETEFQSNSFGKLDAYPFGFDSATRTLLNLPDVAGLIGDFPYMPLGDRTNLSYCKKQIIVTDIPDWVKDVQILAHFHECSPAGSENENNLARQGIIISRSGIVEGGETLTNGITAPSRACRFDIIATFGITDQVGSLENLRSAANKATFLVTRGDYKSVKTNGITLSRCVYPSVEFTVVGYADAQCNPVSTTFGIQSTALGQEVAGLTNAQRIALLETEYRPRYTYIKAN